MNSPFSSVSTTASLPTSSTLLPALAAPPSRSTRPDTAALPLFAAESALDSKMVRACSSTGLSPRAMGISPLTAPPRRAWRLACSELGSPQMVIGADSVGRVPHQSWSPPHSERFRDLELRPRNRYFGAGDRLKRLRVADSADHGRRRRPSRLGTGTTDECRRRRYGENNEDGAVRADAKRARQECDAERVEEVVKNPNLVRAGDEAVDTEFAQRIRVRRGLTASDNDIRTREKLSVEAVDDYADNLALARAGGGRWGGTRRVLGGERGRGRDE